MRKEGSNQHVCVCELASQETKTTFDFRTELRKSSCIAVHINRKTGFEDGGLQEVVFFFLHCCGNRAIRKSPVYSVNSQLFPIFTTIYTGPIAIKLPFV